MAKTDPYAALRIREFNIFLLLRFALVFGWSMQFIIIEWEVYRITKDPWAIGLIGLMEIIPAFYVNDGTIDGTSFNFHLDNINLYNSTQEKIDLMAIEAPVQENCFSSAEEIIVRIKNRGFPI